MVRNADSCQEIPILAGKMFSSKHPFCSFFTPMFLLVAPVRSGLHLILRYLSRKGMTVFSLAGFAIFSRIRRQGSRSLKARGTLWPVGGWKRLHAALLALALCCATTAVGLAQVGVNEFLPRQAPVLKRFSIVAITANNQCFTVQIINSDVTRLRPDVLLGPCEFSIDNQSQGFFISRSIRERNQIFFAANPAYCLAMDRRSRKLVAVACGMNADMYRDHPQFFDLRRGGIALEEGSERWCLDTRAREGFSQIFEPFFITCPDQIGDGFLLRGAR